MNPIELEVYRNLFASIAEEMGVVLMRSSFSPNIKERRDFSCAIFDTTGEMVAQAAHIPVHLGSTPMSVAAAREAFSMSPGEHVLLNDPYSGGTHLPDITIVSPVFGEADEPIFYVANRAHHADVGGETPGSLGLTRSIDDEGIRIPPTLWSDELEERIASASRTPQERRGDLHAQIAANRRGISRISEELQRRNRSLTEAASALQDHSERFMEQVLREIPSGSWSFEDRLEGDGFDSGPISIDVDVTIDDGRAVVDFSDSADQVAGPVNVPRAVTVSATLYVFRCLADETLPSNGGYMRRVKIRTRRGTVVDARAPAPVALGNVETSQRITDVVLGALSGAMPDRIPAASCGSMNNLTIGGRDPRHGDRRFAYYETIAGGSGAGPGFDGAPAVHTHMTNTLNTPVEALEHAYPFRIEYYGIRRGSGGTGRFQGGDGVRRQYRFDAEATVGVMTERRATGPYGLSGGHSGSPGRNQLIDADGSSRKLDAKESVDVDVGDALLIETPGGGGWGGEEGED